MVAHGGFVEAGGGFVGDANVEADGGDGGEEHLVVELGEW